MYNLTQFVLRFFLVFSLHVFIIRLHLQKLLYLCAYIYIYILIPLFYHSLDNDRNRSKQHVLLLVFIVKC